jgi:hypothetical protein
MGPPCGGPLRRVAVSLILLGIWSFVGTDTRSASDEISADFEETMLAVIDQSGV